MSHEQIQPKREKAWRGFTALCSWLKDFAGLLFCKRDEKMGKVTRERKQIVLVGYILTPVRISRQIEGGTCEICDADGFYLCSTVCREAAKQIVEALNAQKPKCETCGGSKKIPNGYDEGGYDNEDPSAYRPAEMIPCPDCQQPITQAKPKGELDEG